MLSPQHTALFLLTHFLCSAFQLIPGPGLPSLPSLNLITANPHNMPLPSPDEMNLATATANALSPFTPTCGPANNAYTNVHNLIVCYNYSPHTRWLALQRRGRVGLYS